MIQIHSQQIWGRIFAPASVIPPPPPTPLHDGCLSNIYHTRAETSLRNPKYFLLRKYNLGVSPNICVKSCFPWLPVSVHKGYLSPSRRGVIAQMAKNALQLSKMVAEIFELNIHPIGSIILLAQVYIHSIGSSLHSFYWLNFTFILLAHMSY